MSDRIVVPVAKRAPDIVAACWPTQYGAVAVVGYRLVAARLYLAGTGQPAVGDSLVLDTQRPVILEARLSRIGMVVAGSNSQALAEAARVYGAQLDGKP